jgi:hypothetical protein
MLIEQVLAVDVVLKGEDGAGMQGSIILHIGGKDSRVDFIPTNVYQPLIKKNIVQERSFQLQITMWE